MTDFAYVTQEMWDRAQAALRAAMPVIEEHVPPLSTAGTMISLRDQVRAAISGAAPETGTAPEPPEKTWECSICGRNNFVTVTYCAQCEYSRMILREGRLVPRDGYR